MEKPDRVDFRPGPLAARLTAEAGLNPGTVAKRDLTRYYALMTNAFELLAEYYTDQPSWDIIVAFVRTREWLVVPNPADFAEAFSSFLRSPMARGYKPEDRQVARDAINSIGLTQTEVNAIIDAAERGVTIPAAAKAGATSATG
jgi:hypothetical protein